MCLFSIKFPDGCWTLLLVLALLLQACAGHDGAERSGWGCDAAADQAVAAGNWDDARRRHENLLAEQPRNCLAWYHLGFISGKLGQRSEEIAAYRKALACGYDQDDQLFFNLGMAYGDLRQYEQARAAFSSAVSINPRNADNYFGLGLVAKASGDQATAERALLKAVAVEPRHQEARLALAGLYVDGNRWEMAERQLVAVLAHDPRHPQALEMLKTVESRKRLLYTPR